MRHRKLPYDPIPFWVEEGKSYYDRFRRTRAFIDQEDVLTELSLDYLWGRAYPRVLEAGCGFGRIGALLSRVLDGELFYCGFDLSEDQLQHARDLVPGGMFVQSTIDDFPLGGEPFDLVLVVEVLMHVKPEDLERTVNKLRTYGPLITVDWTEPVEGAVAPWNFLHDYEAVGLRPIRQVGKQTIFSSDG